MTSNWKEFVLYWLNKVFDILVHFLDCANRRYPWSIYHDRA